MLLARILDISDLGLCSETIHSHTF